MSLGQFGAAAAALAMAAAAHANFADFGFLGNDGVQLTHATFPEQRPVVLDNEPAFTNEPGYTNPRGFGSFYYGDGLTHKGEPITPWSGAPTSVALTLVSSLHNGVASTGLRLASGEHGAFNDIFVNGVHPQTQYGVGEPFLFVTAAEIAAGVGAGTGAHAHIYIEADAPGEWLATFMLTDIGDPPIYGASNIFTMTFDAVPEPASLTALAIAALACGRRRR